MDMRRVPLEKNPPGGAVLLLIALLALGCAGCGRSAGLDPPPLDASAVADSPSANGAPAQPKKAVRSKKTKITPPKGPFFLDPLV